MPFFRETPSSVLYDDLHRFGGMSNIDAARILLSSRVTAGGQSPRDKAESRTYLSRNVVHVSPENVDPSSFAEFEGSTLTVSSRILAKQGHDRQAIVQHYATEAAQRMAKALAGYALDARVYLNEVTRLAHARLRSEKDRSSLLVMLFCITGCLADPERATGYVEDYARHKLVEDIATSTSDIDESSPETSSLGLIRVEGTALVPPIHPLEPQGTNVGSLASGAGAIRDVKADVSREHLRVWFDGDRWLCQGLHSTNGTRLTSGVTGETLVVEPPRTQRNESVDWPPQEIREGDRLRLGKSTDFLVVSVAR